MYALYKQHTSLRTKITTPRELHRKKNAISTSFTVYKKTNITDATSIKTAFNRTIQDEIRL